MYVCMYVVARIDVDVPCKKRQLYSSREGHDPHDFGDISGGVICSAAQCLYILFYPNIIVGALAVGGCRH